MPDVTNDPPTGGKPIPPAHPDPNLAAGSRAILGAGVPADPFEAHVDFVRPADLHPLDVVVER
jgi:hypothetical protein